MLRDGTICPINSPYASPVVLTRKKNDLPPDSPEAYRFAIDYRKLNVITEYPRYPLPVNDDLLTNIPHTGVMYTLDLRSGYYQLAISPKDIEKRLLLLEWHFCILPDTVWPFGGGAEFSKSNRNNIKTCYWAFRVGLYGRCHLNIAII
ncbi:transposon Ty3-I Gag-Pol polyprotein [Trichonephila clavipes]|nr:transposon Ty3-I Gag-Pol polyprotein [Trichonephila clavipes]